MKARKLGSTMFGTALLAAAASAQVPDLMTAFDAGGRAMGMGGGIYLTGADSHSVTENPAGLGFVSRPVFGLSFRNLPESRSLWRNEFADPDITTTKEAGDRTFTHFGGAIPFGKDAAIGVAYSVEGFIHDTRRSVGDLDNGDTTIRDYNETLTAKTDLFTISYGRRAGDSGVNWGAGLVIANQYVRNRVDQTVVSGGNNLPEERGTRVSGNGFGLGLVAGVQVVPKNQPNAIFAASLRTPIDISSNEETEDYYDRIPGRLSAGGAYRLDGFRGGRDYLILGAQLDYYFGGDDNAIIARDAGYLGFGAGLEYSYRMGQARFPVRFGLQTAPGSGDGFGSRNAVTFGFGYYPLNNDFSLDVNFASASGGSMDMAVGLTFRPRN